MSYLTTIGMLSVRAYLLWLFWGRNYGWALILGASELFALVSTARGVARERLDRTLTGAMVPLLYCVPSLFGNAGLTASSPLLVLGLVMLSAWQTYLRFFMGWGVTVGAPMLVNVLSTGPYRVVRHPLSTTEIGICCLYPLAYQSASNFLIGACSIAAIATAIHFEELFLRSDAGYRRYAAKTRGAIIPQ